MTSLEKDSSIGHLVEKLHSYGLSQLAAVLNLWLVNCSEKQYKSLCFALYEWNEEHKNILQVWVEKSS